MTAGFTTHSPEGGNHEIGQLDRVIKHLV